MEHKKQILVLEDLSIPKEQLNTIVAENDLHYELVWSADQVERAEAVEGIITVKTKVDAAVLEKYPNVTFVAVAFTGYDCVDLDACTQAGIDVLNVPSYSTNSVSELVIGQAIALLRNIPSADTAIRTGVWDVSPGQELAGKTVGILGTGAIGMQTALLFKAFGCQVVGWSRTHKEDFSSIGTYIADQSDFYAASDIVCVHLPLNEHTAGLVGEKAFKAMKNTAYIINTARGPVIDEAALVSALKNNEIAGAAIDVFAQEPVAADNELLKLPNCVLTPHIAYKTEEALVRRASITIENIVSSLAGAPVNKVNE